MVTSSVPKRSVDAPFEFSAFRGLRLVEEIKEGELIVDVDIAEVVVVEVVAVGVVGVEVVVDDATKALGRLGKA